MTMMGNTAGITRIEALVVIALFGLLAAIGVPALIRAEISANEAEAIADTRAVISAEQTYASANGGLFDDLRNLCRDGKECNGIRIPGYPPDAPEFLSGELGRSSPYRKGGYERSWIGVATTNDYNFGPVSPTSVLDYCYMSTPLEIGYSGVRSFSGGGNGALSTDPTGAPIPCPAPAPGCIFE